MSLERAHRFFAGLAFCAWYLLCRTESGEGIGAAAEGPKGSSPELPIGTVGDLGVDSVVPRSYHDSMSTVVKRSISLPADVFEALEAQAAEEGRTVSAALADAADLWLATRRGLRAVRAWEREHGALTAEESAAADRELDRAGVGRR